ncbi:MAG TPA: serine protease [Alphaproteobacteria bacterium]|nr:serine protease [Alphaproteobacteria bacterium]
MTGSVFGQVMMVAIVVALATADSVNAQTQGSRESSGPVVHCHDKERGTVSRVLAAECEGTPITEAEAQKIRAQRVQSIQRAIKGREQPIFTDKRMVSVGTGFFVADGGRIVTNRHVVDHCDALTVETTTGTNASATLIRSDDKLDIALIQANLTTPATAVFQVQDIKPGGSIAVIGYPDQGLPPRKPLMTFGATVALDRTQHNERLAFQADVRPGNSGGPVLDQWGNVVAIVNAKIDTVKIYSQTKQLIRNLGFAITTPAILRFLDQTGTAYRQNAVGTMLTPDQLLERARPFVVRIGCWR